MKKKKKEPVISKKKIKRMKRSDGLKMKLVDKYTMERVVAGSASRYPKRIALRTYAEEGSELTYSELKRKSDAVSLYFLEQGFVKGDRIALIGESCPNWMLAYFGLTGIGLTAVPVLPEFSPKEILHILQDGGVKAVSGQRPPCREDSSLHPEETGVSDPLGGPVPHPDADQRGTERQESISQCAGRISLRRKVDAKAGNSSPGIARRKKIWLR